MDTHVRLGILGGGQLALFLAQAALHRGCRVLIYTQNLEDPACSLSEQVFIGQRDDKKKLTSFFQECDKVLLESEFFLPELLCSIEKETRVLVFPNLDSYKILFSKENQKVFFDSLDISNVKHIKIKNLEELEKVDFPPPYMAKISHGGYDGYGNLEINTKEELEKSLTDFSEDFSKVIVLEQKIKIKNEFASLVIKNKKDSIILPPCQTFQKDSICKLVKFPAQLSQGKQDELLKMMKTLASNLPGVGIYAFEFFEDDNGNLYVNEGAPRVHNSYHYTLEGYDKSQFDLFLDAVLDCDLQVPTQKFEHLSMVNLLGQSLGEDYKLSFPDLGGDYEVKTHMYGKKFSKKGRKLGHLTLYGTVDNLKYAKQISEEYYL